jgi:hypothetical protein
MLSAMSIVPDVVCHCEEYLEGFAIRVLDPNPEYTTGYKVRYTSHNQYSFPNAAFVILLLGLHIPSNTYIFGRFQIQLAP